MSSIVFIFYWFLLKILLNLRMKPYKLKSTLYAHTADVKGLCATKDNGFVSVSRDLSAKIWNHNRLDFYPFFTYLLYYKIKIFLNKIKAKTNMLKLVQSSLIRNM
jgi:WD40 repeat protein